MTPRESLVLSLDSQASLPDFGAFERRVYEAMEAREASGVCEVCEPPRYVADCPGHESDEE